MSIPSKKSPFSRKDEDLIRQLYADQDLVADKLAYHPNFNTMLHTFQAKTGKSIPEHRFWRKLLSMRKKSGGLPSKGHNGQPELPSLSGEEQTTLARLLRTKWGKEVDSLPYTAEFKEIATAFRTKTGCNFNDNEIHRLNVGLRKAYLLRPQRSA